MHLLGCFENISFNDTSSCGTEESRDSRVSKKNKKNFNFSIHQTKVVPKIIAFRLVLMRLRKEKQLVKRYLKIGKKTTCPHWLLRKCWGT
jgi:hypothetical protein